MQNADFLIYPAHGLFWTAFGVAHAWSSRGSAKDPAPAPAAPAETTAPFSRGLVAFHAIAFGVMYFGVGNAVIPNRVPAWFDGQRIVGIIVIATGAALMSWARIWFHSWRFQAKLEVGHQLATGGPFRLMRHPIYMGLNLLAIGTAFWVPTPITWAGVLLMVIGSDLRGRAEERVLSSAFGSRYTEYCAQTRRFVPGVY